MLLKLILACVCIRPQCSHHEVHHFLPFALPRSLNASTVNSELLAYFVQMSAGKSAFETDSRDCERLVTSKDAVLMTDKPVLNMVDSISVLHDSISFFAASSCFFASLHFSRTACTAARSSPVPPFSAVVACLGAGAAFALPLALALALAF